MPEQTAPGPNRSNLKNMENLNWFILNQLKRRQHKSRIEPDREFRERQLEIPRMVAV